MRPRTRFLAASLFLLVSSIGYAQSQRTFVSFSGSDANPCSRALPCRNFTAAVAATAAGGEVIALDSAGYGTVSITQSVSLIAPPGVYAGITNSTTHGISITAPGASVVLRGLTFNEIGGLSWDGIYATSADTLHVEGCVVSRLGYDGIYIVNVNHVFVDDTFVRDSENSAIEFEPDALGLTLYASISRCRFERNNTALYITGSSMVTASDSVLANGARGAYLYFGPELTVKDCIITNNTTGFSLTSSVLTMSGSLVNHSQYGVNASASTVRSFGNNDFSSNTNDVQGATVAKITQQ